MFDFPANPTADQVFLAADGVAWKWNGVAWNAALKAQPRGGRP